MLMVTPAKRASLIPVRKAGGIPMSVEHPLIAREGGIGA